MASHLLVLIILAAATVFALMPCMADNAIGSSDVLLPGQSLTTGNYRFIIQNDCKLVLYDSGNSIWESNSAGVASDCHAILQSNGILAIYDSIGHRMWANNKRGKIANYVLVLQRDRNVVIYGPAIWATNTQKGTIGVTIAPHNSTNSTMIAVTTAEQVIINVA